VFKPGGGGKVRGDFLLHGREGTVEFRGSSEHLLKH